MLALLPALNAGAQSRFAKYLDQAENAPFVVVDKQSLKLTLVDPQGEPIKEYGISVAVNFGHDFKDGKGPIPDAYGPWFLRLDVPGFWDIGIHGTPFPESIGTRATEGCVRLRNEDILDLKSRVKVGTVVIILPDAVEKK